MRIKNIIIVVLILTINCQVLADTRYVDITNPTPTAPYTSWSTAANTIQEAVDASVNGETVQVADGHYLLTSEIVVTNNITIQSANGPESTIVDGQGSVRCFNLGDYACVLSGLTITNGSVAIINDGGGIYCEGTAPMITNCVIIGNSARLGGGIYGGMIFNSIIHGNFAKGSGGGMYNGTANNCMFTKNMAAFSGGGICRGTVNNCTISGNTGARHAGGITSGSANNCIIWYNDAVVGTDIENTTMRYSCSPELTHGVDGNITNKPLLISVMHVATNSPCRGAGSSAYVTGTDIEGEAWGTPPSMGCDEYPGSATGFLNVKIACNENKAIVNHPIRFNASIDGMVSSHIWDFGDGTIVSNSAYTEHAWGGTGTYAVVLSAYNDTYPSGVLATQWVEVAYADDVVVYVAKTGDSANDGSSWAKAKDTIQSGIDVQEYAGGVVAISNGTYELPSEITVTKAIVIRGENPPEETIVDGQGADRCFNLGNSDCVISGLTITNGYTSGDGGGIYCTGSRPVVTHCTIAGNSSRYGGGMSGGNANHSIFKHNVASGFGGGIADIKATQCIISGNAAHNFGGGMSGGIADNCSILFNTASNYGGGMAWGIVNNCSISGNTAENYGGGLSSGTANNCTISGNTAENSGGGMDDSTANNCTISGNNAISGGGISFGTANNCIVWYNDSLYVANHYRTVAHTCSPDTTHGVDGNITNAPLFVDRLNGDYRLLAASPCINAGHNDSAPAGTDLDGNPRMAGGVVDMGAYERQDAEMDVDGDGMEDWWEMMYLVGRHFAVPDATCSNAINSVLEAYIAGLDPTNSASTFTSTNIHPDASGFVIEWAPSISDRLYTVNSSTNLTNDFQPLETGIEFPQNSFTDTVHTAENQGFYQVEVQLK